MERLWVKDVQIGQAAAGTFLVTRKQTGVGRNEKAFLRITLQDRTGQLDARVWDRVEELGALFEAGDRVQVRGQIGSFQGRPQLTIEGLEKVEGEHDPAEFDFTPPTPAPTRGGGEAQVAQLREELARVEDPHVRALLLSFIDDPEIASRLARAPAAKEIHHAYAGGLVEHILSCVRLARRLADHYPMADRDLLVAGAFLHDIGKIQELSLRGGNIAYTDEGRLVGHLVMTAQWIAERAKVITGFPKELEHHLTHLVLAHHGRLEYGSPKVPHTIEAFLVHALDEIDSRMNQMLGQMARAPGEKWAEPQRHWERLLWKAPAPTEGGKLRGAPGRSRRRKKRREPTEAAAKPAPSRAPAAPPPSRTPAASRPPKARTEPAPRKAAPKKEEPSLSFKPFSALTGQEEPSKEPSEARPTTEPSETPQAPVPTSTEKVAETTPSPAPTEEPKAEAAAPEAEAAAEPKAETAPAAQAEEAPKAEAAPAPQAEEANKTEAAAEPSPSEDDDQAKSG